MPTVIWNVESAPAAVSSSRSTRRGRSASSAGRCSDHAPAATTETAKIRTTDGCVNVEFQASSARHRHQRELGQEHEAAAVDDVGERAPEQPEREHGHELGEAEQADRQRRAGERVDLVRDRDERQHRAQERRQLPEEEQPEVAVAAQRADVDERVAQRAPQLRHRPSETCAS